MAQTLTENGQSSSTGKVINVGLWILQIGAAGMFLMVGFFKFSGDPQMVELFETIGFGQWFRYVTGSLEILGAGLIVIPRLSGLGALLVGVMLGAVATHLFIVVGSPLPAIILLIVTGVIALGRRKQTMNLLALVPKDHLDQGF